MAEIVLFLKTYLKSSNSLFSTFSTTVSFFILDLKLPSPKNFPQKTKFYLYTRVFSAVLECGLNLNSQNSFIWDFIMSLVAERLLQWLSRKDWPPTQERWRTRFVPWVEQISRKRNGSPLQYSGFKNLRDWGAWHWHCTVHGVAESDMTQWLNNNPSNEGFWPRVKQDAWGEVRRQNGLASELFRLLGVHKHESCV